MSIFVGWKIISCWKKNWICWTIWTDAVVPMNETFFCLTTTGNFIFREIKHCQKTTLHAFWVLVANRFIVEMHLSSMVTALLSNIYSRQHWYPRRNYPSTCSENLSKVSEPLNKCGHMLCSPLSLSPNNPTPLLYLAKASEYSLRKHTY